MTNLFPTIRRKVEDKNSEEGDAHAGNDKVYGVKQSFSPHRDVESDV